jgi:hypothetical protein
MTEKEIQEQRIRLEWVDGPGKATAEHGGVEYGVSVDLVGSSGGKDWEWLVWVDGRAHFAPRLAERLCRDKETGVEQGKLYAEGIAFNAQEIRDRRAAARA